MPALKSKLSEAFLLAIAVVVYFAAGRLGLAVASGYTLASPIWPPTGLALAGLLLLGRQFWPVVMVGAFLVNLTRLAEVHTNWLMASLVSLGIAGGNSIEAWVGAWLIERFAHGRDAFRQPQMILRFVAVALLSTAIGATIGAAVVAAGGLEAQRHPAHFWLTWWLGDLVSAIVLTPLILVWTAQRAPALSLKRVPEGVGLLGLLALISWLVFGGGFAAETGGANLSFLIIPPLLWAALRFGTRGTASVAFLIACLAIAGTFRGHGPFALTNRLTSIIVLQNFIAVIAVMSLMLAADVTQRQWMESGLRASEQHYRELFEFSPQPMWVYDYETLRFLAVNDAAIELYGYSRQEFLSLLLTEIRPPEAIPQLLEDVARARAGNRSTIKRQHRKKDGSLMDVELSRHSVLFDGRPAAMVLCRDISERRRAELRATAFSELGRRLSTATTPRGAAQIIAKAADLLFGWDACILELCSPDQKSLESVFCVDTVEGKRVEFKASDPKPGSFALEILAGGPRLILRPDPPTFEPGTTPVGDTHRPSASLMYVPLREEQQPIGILSIQSYRHNAYSEEDLHTLRALAEHCGGALARLRAEEKIQRLNAELEQRVRQRTAQMEAINKELEAFCYSVSHDLRAPLRSIRGFSEVLLERYADNLDARGQEFLRRACESSVQMDLLIEDLLKLSRVSRNELQQRSVDLSALAEGIVSALRQAEPQRIVRAVIAPNLGVQGDEGLLRIVLENLLRNAWKFTGTQPNPSIEFGFLSEPHSAFFVRDNGAGFDMAHAGRLFGVFQRLHSTAEFPGNGVGLATVQRIINRHGGRTWAEGAPDRGATFYFTLPALS